MPPSDRTVPSPVARVADRTAAATTPRHVELLVGFANSIDHELGTDDLTTAAELTTWLMEHRLLDAGRSTAADLALARRLRQGVHAALVANHDDDVSNDLGRATAAVTPARVPPSLLDDVAAELPLRLTASGAGPTLEPVLDGVRGALSWLLVAINDAVVDDTWRRLKICSADECAWAYYDATKNRSRRWCEWGCGNRQKTRSYRARQRAARR